MSRIIDIALLRTRTVILAFLMILTAGVIAYIDIPKEADPDIPIPIIYILLKHDGISPEDSERQLLQSIEPKLRSIGGVKEVRSSAYTGGASIILEFDAGFDSSKALYEVRERVDIGKADLPPDTKEPIIKEVNLNLFPVLIVTLSGNIPERTLLKYARNLRDELEGISSVLEANLTGTRKEVVEIIVNPAQLDSYKIDAIQVIQTIARSNLLIAAGTLDAGNGRFPIKVPGLYEDLPSILEQPLKVSGDSVVTIGDIANVRKSFKDPSSIARLAGEKSLGIEIKKRSGENIIETVKRVQSVVETTSKNWPDGLKYTFSQDRSTNIKTMLRELQNNIISAVLLVMIIIVGALGWRSGALVGMAIPGSFLLGILVLSLLGLSINIVVLFSLILSVGMLVDGAIVVTEFADRQQKRGFLRREAYKTAAKRMALPIIASTATTLAAFFPLIFWPGIVGEFMKFLPITLVAVLCASLIMALIFVPTIGGLFGSGGNLPAVVPLPSDPDKLPLHERISAFGKSYKIVLEKALNNPGKILLAAILILVGVQYTYFVAGNGLQFFPNIEPETANIYVRARGNMSIHEKAKLLHGIEHDVLNMREVKSVYTYIGKLKGAEEDLPKDIIGKLQLEFIDWKERRKTSLILKNIIEKSKNHPGLIIEFMEEKKGPPSGKPLKIRLTSENLNHVGHATKLIRDKMEQIPGLTNIEDDRDIPAIEWELKIDRRQAAKFGADVALIGNYVQLLTNGMKVTTFNPIDNEEEIDVVVRYPKQLRKLDQFDKIKIKTSSGMVPIENFVNWAPQAKVGTIKRVNTQRTRTIKSDVKQGVLPNTMVNEIKSWLKDSKLPKTVSVQFKGEDEEQEKAKSFLVRAFSVALFIMAVVLVTQFNSFYSAFLILSAVVMSTIGVLIGLLITGKPFGVVMTGVGVIALAGIVVNNNIVLIDTFDYLRKSSQNVREAVLQAGMERLRPVLLTTVTTILGLLPMVLQINVDFVTREISIGAPSTQWWVSLSTAIVFGLSFATILTLIVTPCALQFRANLQDAIRNYREKNRYDR